MLNSFKTYFFILTFLWGSVFSQTQSNIEEQHLKVVLRTIGHEFLLQMGDSTSRVLPINKIDNRYRIQFENDFSIEPDLISIIATKVFYKNNIHNRYIMEVETCDSSELIYSFEHSIALNTDLIPCKSRALPNNCYFFYFTILEDLSKSTTLDQESSNLSTIIYSLLGMLLLASIFYFSFRKKRMSIEAFNPEWIVIGEYYFDKKNMKLIHKGVVEDLSGKELDLLELFYINKNKTLEREYILNAVWNDEGDYIGRTLDVSISKLRKKLKKDSNLKIINIRGVGYRFVIG